MFSFTKCYITVLDVKTEAEHVILRSKSFHEPKHRVEEKGTTYLVLTKAMDIQKSPHTF